MPKDQGLLIDSNYIQDVFVSGLARVDDIGGGCFRFTFYVSQKSMLDNSNERVVVARIVTPLEAIRAGMCLTEAKVESAAKASVAARSGCH